jgi:hypothetical protein
MKKITLFICLFFAFVGFSQEVLQDFENGGLAQSFGGLTSAKIVDDPAPSGGNRGKVAELISSSAAGAMSWQGVNIALAKNVQLTATNKTMTIEVYSTVPVSLLLKVNGGISGAQESAGEVDHTGNGWETLTVTFDKVRDGKAIGNGVYSTFVIHTNWNTPAVTFQNPPVARTIYVNNISGIVASAPPAPTPPTTAAPTPPVRAPENVLSFYSDAYTNVAIDNFDFGLCDGGIPNRAVKEIMINGNATQNYLKPGCQGISIETNRLDASTFTKLHFDFYTDQNLVGAVFNIKLVDWAGNPTEAGASGLEVNFNAGTSTRLVSGTWVLYYTDIG